MYLTMRNVWGVEWYRLSNYSEGQLWWWMEVSGNGADCGPFDTRSAAIEWGMAHGHVS
jgi:hypothetical protein